MPRGFGQAAGRMFYGEPPHVELGIDPSRRAESGMLQGLLMKHGVVRMQQLFSDPAAGQESIAAARRSLPPSGASPRVGRDREHARCALRVPQAAARCEHAVWIRIRCRAGSR